MRRRPCYTRSSIYPMTHFEKFSAEPAPAQVPSSPERSSRIQPIEPPSPSVESDKQPYTRTQLNRALLRLRDDCTIFQKRAEERYVRKEAGPEEVMLVTDTRIRAWLEHQLKAPGRYAETFMEESRSPRHACGDVTFATQDGAAVTFEHPMAILGFHYLVSDIKKALPVMVFCEPEIADEMRSATALLTRLDGFLKRDWPISRKPVLGLVPVELDPKVFTEQKLVVSDTTLSFRPKKPSKGKNTLPDPSLENPYGLEHARIGRPITLLEPARIAKLVPLRPILTSNTEDEIKAE